MSLFDDILAARGLSGVSADFLFPDYDKKHDPYLLPDMEKAVKRLVKARKNQEHITIYGDYDIDGLTATTVLIDAFASFGFEYVDAFIPNRFVEGYGLTVNAVEQIVASGTQLIVTVDCGSVSYKEVEKANELGVDVIVTDHHTMGDNLPPAVAVINPKRSAHTYPFIDLAGVGVAFKLVQALQTRLEGLPEGSEKWLLDLVALGTVCDVVTLLDENRANVYWGLQVLAKTRRPGLKALMAVARVEPGALNSRSLGFALGPRMNASGRLETARHSLDMLLATDSAIALEKAEQLDALNVSRRTDQAKIFNEAIIQAEKYINDPVLVVSGADWNHGIVGIVAAKLLEKYQKPTYVLQEMGESSKGSARSYGGFSAVAAIRAAGDIITKGGGHTLAAGVTLPTANIDAFRTHVNKFYKSLKLTDQAALLLPKADVVINDLSEVTEDLVMKLAGLEPFGSGNPEPILQIEDVIVTDERKMGTENQHVKLEVKDKTGKRIQVIAFSAPDHFFATPGEQVSILFQPTLNEWKGRRSVEGKLLHVNRD
ncbi:MAG: recJ [Candidatus Saccharibacteria bacterium]|nr:recJ [Candidatus Saccharibacteria bacterium]